MSFERVPLDQFKNTFTTAVELSSVALGGLVCSVSDEFFAEAHHLLRVEPAPSLKGQFGPKGALFSGWETRRHNPSHDWCIIKLGCLGAIFGFDVDTAHFNGNEAPEVSVDALYSPDQEHPKVDDPEWIEILPKVALGPDARHLFRIPLSAGVNYVKLKMYPDGGIARFRVYGLVTPVFPPQIDTLCDLAHVFAGGRVVYTSDQHFGVGSNLILPGRGKDMGDGWETKRSRVKGHRDWAIVKLGDAGIITRVEIDTAHFMGNFPESCEVHAVNSADLIPNLSEDEWTLVLPRTKLGPHRQHYFQLVNSDEPFTHIKVTIYPDGGIKRVRAIGRRVHGVSGVCGDAVSSATSTIGAKAQVRTIYSPPSSAKHPDVESANKSAIPALTLTAEAFAVFGQVVQAYSDANAVPSPRTTRVTGANQGTAVKFHKLALLESSYPTAAGATSGISVYRCKPITLDGNAEWDVKLLERHLCTKQAFIPMGGAPDAGGDALENPGLRYLVIVALNGDDDKPDLKSMRAFIASAGQGIVYNTGIWHHPMAALDRDMDFACVETQIGDDSRLDCEIVDLNASHGYYRVAVPA